VKEGYEGRLQRNVMKEFYEAMQLYGKKGRKGRQEEEGRL
jgi:hypothetical protein